MILRSACALFLVSAALAAQGRVFSTVDAALARAFPKCEVKRTTVYLTEAEQKRVTELSGKKFTRSMVYPYVARKDGKLVGTAYFDNHRVRTLRETLMTVVTPDCRIGRVEVLAFGEPTEYMPRRKWYDRFEERKLDRELNLKRDIDGVSGATLTCRATTDCARRSLALHRVLADRMRRAAAEKSAGRTKTTPVEGKKTGRAKPTKR